MSKTRCFSCGSKISGKTITRFVDKNRYILCKKCEGLHFKSILAKKENDK